MRQKALLASLAIPQVGILTTSLTVLPTSLSAVAINLDATAGRMQACAEEMQAAVEEMDSAAARKTSDGAATAQQTAVEGTLAAYAARVVPKPLSAEIVADWGASSRPECRAPDALADATSCPQLAVGVTGMGGLGTSTTLQLGCARLADTGGLRGGPLFRVGQGRVGAARSRLAGNRGQVDHAAGHVPRGGDD